MLAVFNKMKQSLVRVKAGFWREAWGGALCIPEIFSTSPKNFRTSPNNIINEINFKRQLYKLDKKV